MDEERLLEQQRQHFNSIADRYHQGRRGANHLYLKELLWADALRPFQGLAGRRLDVLEPMCGFCDGHDILTRHLTNDIAYHGFDYSDSVIETVKAERPGLDIWQADATKFVPTEDYDIIIVLGGVHHTPSAAASIVRQLVPALRSGGLFISLEPTHGNPVFQKVRDLIYRQNSLFDEGTERAFPVADLLSMSADTGLQPASILYPGLLSYVLYYNPDAFPLLNIGGKTMVSATYSFDRLFYRTALGRALSFATLGIWRKP